MGLKPVFTQILWILETQDTKYKWVQTRFTHFVYLALCHTVWIESHFMYFAYFM